MKNSFAALLILLVASAAHAQYQQVNLTVFGMDCAPCAHAIRVSMKGIQGVNTINVDLNTGLVAVTLAPLNTATMRQFNQAVEKNGFTHKAANITVRGTLSGTVAAPSLEVTGTQDHYALASNSTDINLSPLMGKQVLVVGVLPQASRGSLPDQLRYSSIAEAK